MRYREAGNWWVCPGWDGEGCCAFAAETFTEDKLIVKPSGPSSRWGFRAAVPATLDA